MSLKILLADDSMTAQNMGKKILADAGYEVIAVSNGAAAVKKIAEINPHILILDIYMPGYTGLEVCEKVKSSAATARMPVLLTVGKMEPYKPEEGARVRADGVIVKPFEASELLRAVQRFSQRASGPATAQPTAVPPAPPVPLPATYERTVKLTREQIREMMDPNSPKWQGGTANPDLAPAVAARTDIPVDMAQSPAFSLENIVASTVTTSTADSMPSFAMAAVAEEPVSTPVEPDELPAMADLASSTSTRLGKLVSPTSLEELPNASSLLPGFVDYLIAQSLAAQPEMVDDEPFFAMGLGTVSPEAAKEIARSASFSEKLADAQSLGYEIPSVDPALEVAPPVSIVPTADPHFEPVSDLPVANATEDGLMPTSRAPESASVETTTDPNLAPMETLNSAVEPLEGGQLIVPEPVEAAPVPPPEVVAPPPTRKSKKAREMKPLKVEPANEIPETTAASTEATEAEPGPSVSSKPEVTEEIAAVLNMLHQTAGTVMPSNGTHSAGGNHDAEAVSTFVAGAARVWMAEEVALSETEFVISLENEMRVAYAAMIPAPEPVQEGLRHREAPFTAFTRAEEPVRDDKNAPQPAMPDPREPSPGSAASPTHELAAAMAAAFGGALPKEDLARAEETQSISEEVRRFAMGETFKPKHGFGGAAIEDPEEVALNKARIAAAIGRALDRLKPQIVAEIMRELETKDE